MGSIKIKRPFYWIPEQPAKPFWSIPIPWDIGLLILAKELKSPKDQQPWFMICTGTTTEEA